MIEENAQMREQGGYLLSLHFVLNFILTNQVQEYFELIIDNIQNQDENLKSVSILTLGAIS